MMKLGFVTAIVPELNLAETAGLARESGYDCLEVMCWPPGKSERRYAGVTHIDVTDYDVSQVRDSVAAAGVSISGLGYYPNPLVAGQAEAQVYIDHLYKVVDASAALGIGVANTFVGRDHTKSIDENWPRFLEVFRPLVKYAGDKGVKIGIENCPMSFTRDEWPGGKNLAVSPKVWRRMFEDIPDANFGLNFDPSHLVWQMMDIPQAIREFHTRFHHVHAKDARLDRERLNEVGLLAYPLEFHTPKLPGLGDVDWSAFFSALNQVSYRGPVCVEMEDRAYEGSLDDRKHGLRQCARYLRQFIG